MYCYNCNSHKLSSFSYNFCYNVIDINYHFYSSYQVCDTCFPEKLSDYFYCTKRLTTEFNYFEFEQFTLFLKTMKKYKLNFIKVNNVEDILCYRKYWKRGLFFPEGIVKTCTIKQLQSIIQKYN